MHPDLIPGWLLAIIMLHLAYTGIRCHLVGITLDPIFFLVLIPQAGMYLFFSLIDLPLEIRGFWTRISALLIPACFDFILVSQYRRRRKSHV